MEGIREGMQERQAPDKAAKCEGWGSEGQEGIRQAEPSRKEDEEGEEEEGEEEAAEAARRRLVAGGDQYSCIPQLRGEGEGTVGQTGGRLEDKVTRPQFGTEEERDGQRTTGETQGREERPTQGAAAYRQVTQVSR